MPNRRILSLWFPRLGAERLVRLERGTFDAPLVVLRDTGQMQVISSLNKQAEALGLTLGQPVRDAQAVCPEVIIRLQNVQAEAAFLAAIRRWAGKFSPWLAEDAPNGLVIDLTGCVHLFGGERGVLEQIARDCVDLGLTVRAGIADTLGAAWALARFAEKSTAVYRSSDDIQQEARATRARAVRRRHWTRGGTPPQRLDTLPRVGRIAPPGQTRSILADLPVAGLRLTTEIQADLARLGLRRIGDLAGQPRAGLVRRFGKGVVLRLDQALGSVPEPISPAAPAAIFAVRMTLPEPIGLEADLLAGINRLLPPLCERLRAGGLGARAVRLQVFRTDQTMQSVDVGLARAADDAERIRPLLRMKLGDIDAGFGIDMLRIEAIQTEPLHHRCATGHLEAGQAVAVRLAAGPVLDDLIGRIGARIGLEQITRRHPASSHIPEKCAQMLHAAWSDAFQSDWPEVPGPRPILLLRPEPLKAPDKPRLTGPFLWRGRDMHWVIAQGPERIAPEWWIDEPNWRSGVRDYWRVTCESGERLWLYYAHGGTMSSGWFCHGTFA